MSVGIAQITALAAAILVAGIFLLFRRPTAPAGGLVMTFTAAALELAGVSRFAASLRDPLTGQEFAVLVMFSAVPIALLAQRWPGGEDR